MSLCLSSSRSVSPLVYKSEPAVCGCFVHVNLYLPTLPHTRYTYNENEKTWTTLQINANVRNVILQQMWSVPVCPVYCNQLQAGAFLRQTYLPLQKSHQYAKGAGLQRGLASQFMGITTHICSPSKSVSSSPHSNSLLC